MSVTPYADRKPRRSRIAPGVWMLDYRMGWLEVVDDEGEELARADRFLQSEGASFSGWVVRQGADFSDPIGTKEAAVELLKLWSTASPS